MKAEPNSPAKLLRLLKGGKQPPTKGPTPPIVPHTQKHSKQRGALTHVTKQFRSPPPGQTGGKTIIDQQNDNRVLVVHNHTQRAHRAVPRELHTNEVHLFFPPAVQQSPWNQIYVDLCTPLQVQAQIYRQKRQGSTYVPARKGSRCGKKTRVSARFIPTRS